MISLCLTIAIIGYMKYSIRKDIDVFFFYVVTGTIDFLIFIAIVEVLINIK